MGKTAGETATSDRQAIAACASAKALVDAGSYASARNIMLSFWQQVGARPNIGGLARDVAAEVLLISGIITGWIGSNNQTYNTQDTAKDLISESRDIFVQLERWEKAAEAETALGVCYWREGAFDEARIILRQAVSRIGQHDNEIRLSAEINLALVEWSAGNTQDSIALYQSMAPRIEAISSNIIRARFHHGRALNFRKLDDYDNALLENAMASYFYEAAGNRQFCAVIENNTGFIYYTLGNYGAALEHLSRARSIFCKLKNSGMTAQVDDTRARVFLNQQNYVEAEKAARDAISVLEKGNEYALLVESLTTLATILARQKNACEAACVFKRAYELCCTYMTSERAAEVATTMIQEIDFTQAANVKTEITSSPAMPFEEAVLLYEESLIRQALEASGGVIKEAAMRLGLRSYQHLQYILNTRHSGLLNVRSEIIPRKKIAIRAKGGADGKTQGKVLKYSKREKV